MNIQLINMLWVMNRIHVDKCGKVWVISNLMILNDYKNSYFIMVRCEGIAMEVSNVEQNLMFGL